MYENNRTLSSICSVCMWVCAQAHIQEPTNNLYSPHNLFIPARYIVRSSNFEPSNAYEKAICFRSLCAVVTAAFLVVHLCWALCFLFFFSRFHFSLLQCFLLFLCPFSSVNLLYKYFQFCLRNGHQKNRNVWEHSTNTHTNESSSVYIYRYLSI